MSELKRTHDETEIEWTAYDIFHDIATDEFSFISPPFIFGTSTLRLKLAGIYCIDFDDTTLGLIVESKTNFLLRSNLPLKCTYGLKNSDGTVEQLGVTIMKADVEESKHNFAKLCEVMQQKFNQGFSEVVTITFTFKVEFFHGIEPQSKKLKKEDVLSQNFKDLFYNKLGCDTTIHVKDKEFQAHKTVLTARSRVFAAMFQQETSEKKTGIVTISDCDTESFQEFLEYLYCGELEDVSYQSAFNLYETSKKYNVLELNMFCVELLMENITVKTFYDMASLAHKYDDRKLLSGIQDCFNENATDIVQSSEWDCFTKNNSLLSNKLVEKYETWAGTRLIKYISRAEYSLATK